MRITLSLVSDTISKLGSHKANGCDRVPAIVLKECASKLYNCHNAFCFPVYWKSSSVVPPFKNYGEPSDTANYCPVRLLPIFCKVFNALINAKLVKHLFSHDLHPNKKYVFRFARLTADVLTIIT